MDMTIDGLLAAYQAKRTTPERVIKHVLAACEKYPEHNIWITRLAKEQIQIYLDRLKNQSPATKPLYGIPFAIKDNIDLAGVSTTAACPAFAYVAEKSAFVVECLIEAGAIPIGKTNMDQFATGLVGTRSPEPWGACHNAFNPEYLSGGSSSGSAVAVALGLVSFSLGTDTAGSGRVPAAFNHIIGLKPSRGLLSARGVVPACRSLDCVSIFALTTDDAQAVFKQAAQYDVADDYARPNTFANNYRHYGLADGEFIFAVPKAKQLNFFGNTEAQALFETAVNKMQVIGGIKREIDFSVFSDAASLLYQGPWVAERYVAIEKIISQQADELLPVIKTIISSAKDKTAIDAFKAEYKLQHYRQKAHAIFDTIDFLLTPTTGTLYTIDEINRDPIQLNSNLGFYTNFMNLLDCAAVAVPAGFINNGLPWGISLVAPAMQDQKLLAYANRWQQHMQYTLGATEQALPATQAKKIKFDNYVSVVVCGAHLSGYPLNWQLTERGARLFSCLKTSANYRMFALSGGPPYRPGLIRDEQRGMPIEVEVWQIPSSEFGDFVNNIPAPLAIGKVELANGQWFSGFVCENYAMTDADEISNLGSWRNYPGALT